jgi:hypothetical protein
MKAFYYSVLFKNIYTSYELLASSCETDNYVTILSLEAHSSRLEALPNRITERTSESR